jgi:hypothetical protein
LIKPRLGATLLPGGKRMAENGYPPADDVARARALVPLLGLTPPPFI